MAKGLFQKIADHLIENDDATRDWLSVPAIMQVWYAACICVALLLGVTYFFGPIAAKSAYATWFSRVTTLVLMGGLLCAFTVLGFRYFRYVLTHNRPIFFQNVMLFYVGTAVVYSRIYSGIYVLYPKTFSYLNPPAIAETVTSGFQTWQLSADFLLFSGFQSFGIGHFKIQVASSLVGVIALAQVLTTYAIVSLFVASYVNQKIKQARQP